MFSRNKLILESVDTNILMETSVQKTIDNNYVAAIQAIDKMQAHIFTESSNVILASKVNDFFYFANIKKTDRKKYPALKVGTLKYGENDYESCEIMLYKLSTDLTIFTKPNPFKVNVYYQKSNKDDSAIDSISEAFFYDGAYIFALHPTNSRTIQMGNPLCEKDLLKSDIQRAYKKVSKITKPESKPVENNTDTSNELIQKPQKATKTDQKYVRANNTVGFNIQKEKFLMAFKKKTKTVPLTKEAIDQINDQELDENEKKKTEINNLDKWKNDQLGPSNVINDGTPFTVDGLVKKATESLESMKKGTPVLSNKFEATFLQEIIEDTNREFLKFDAPEIKGFKYNESEYKSLVSDINAKPMEMVQPIALSKLDKMCSFNGANVSKDNFVIAMCDGNEANIGKMLVRFPKSGTEMLYDSIEYIPQNDGNTYKPLYISSKAGYGGKGASASIVSLGMGLFHKDTPDITKIRNEAHKAHSKELKEGYAEAYVDDILSRAMNKFNNSLFSVIVKGNKLPEFKSEAITLAAFILSKPTHHEMVANVLINKYHTIPSYSYNGISTQAMTRLILYILNSMKYDFAQIDTKVEQHFDAEGDSNVTLKHTIQYPAVFEGSCKVEIKKDHGVFFHITGK